MNYKELHLTRLCRRCKNTGNYDEAERLAKEVIASLQSPAEDGDLFFQGVKEKRTPP